MSGKYSISAWGSDRKLQNDDCFTSTEHNTLDEARADIATLKQWHDQQQVNWGYIYIDGPEGEVYAEMNRNPNPAWDQDDHSAEQSERFMVGMDHGVDAYNEANGEAVEDAPDHGHKSFGM